MIPPRIKMGCKNSALGRILQTPHVGECAVPCAKAVQGVKHLEFSKHESAPWWAPEKLINQTCKSVGRSPNPRGEEKNLDPLSIMFRARVRADAVLFLNRLVFAASIACVPGQNTRNKDAEQCQWRKIYFLSSFPLKYELPSCDRRHAVLPLLIVTKMRC